MARSAAVRWRRRLFGLGAAGLGVTAAALLVEVGFRFLWPLPSAFAEFEQAGLYTETGGGGIGFSPGYRGTLRAGDRTTTVAISALGLRGPELAQKRAGERRLLVGGDSLVFGYGVEADEALPALLQARLAERGVAVTAGNAGMPGLGTRDAAWRLRELDAPFGADGFVLCCFLGNDAVDDLRVDRAVCGGLRFDGPMARLVRSSWRMNLAVRSRAALWFETWVFTNHPAWSPLMQAAPGAAELAAMAGLPGEYPAFVPTHAGLFLDAADAAMEFAAGAGPVIPRVLANARLALGEARATAGARPLVFVVLPTRWHLDESAWREHLRELGFDPARFRRGAMQERLLALAAELGVPAVDATVALAAEPERAGLFAADGGHLSARGNRVVADALAAALAAKWR